MGRSDVTYRQIVSPRPTAIGATMIEKDDEGVPRQDPLLGIEFAESLPQAAKQEN